MASACSEEIQLGILYIASASSCCWWANNNCTVRVRICRMERIVEMLTILLAACENSPKLPDQPWYGRHCSNKSKMRLCNSCRTAAQHNHRHTLTAHRRNRMASAFEFMHISSDRFGSMLLRWSLASYPEKEPKVERRRTSQEHEEADGTHSARCWFTPEPIHIIFGQHSIVVAAHADSIHKYNYIRP